MPRKLSGLRIFNGQHDLIVKPRSVIRANAERTTEKKGDLTMSETQTIGQPSPQEQIFGMFSGYVFSRALHVAAELGIADLLSDGPQPPNVLANATGCHQQSLYSLLRILASQGVFTEDETGCFRMTPMGALLQSDVPGSLRDVIRMADEAWWNAAGHLLYSVRTGKPAFDHVNGASFFEYLAKNQEASIRFDRGMANGAATENAAIAEAYDFGQFRRVVDVGGGRGGFLAEVLKAYPSVTGILYDQPQVVQEPEYLSKAKVLDRCEIVSGDFFETVPVGGDARAYYERKPEKHRAYAREYRQRKPEKHRAYAREYRQRNLEKRKAYDRAYYEQHRDERLAYSKRHHRELKERRSKQPGLHTHPCCKV